MIASVLTKKQQRKAEKRRLRRDNKTRQKLELAMRADGSLGRLTAVQQALRQKATADTIYQRIKSHEALFGRIKSYNVLRSLVHTVLGEAGLSLNGVLIRFQFGPGCGTDGCNHPHEDGMPCAFPGCKCKSWSPGQLLGIAAAPSPDTIREAARAAGVEDRLDRPA